jgi:hypothetical protein
MAKERGWWKIEFTVEPNEVDLDHIAWAITEGYVEGEIVMNEFDVEEDNSEEE